MSPLFSFLGRCYQAVASVVGLDSRSVLPSDPKISKASRVLEFNNAPIEIKSNSRNLISGYLNLSRKQGWSEGGQPEVAVSFVHYILSTYMNECDLDATNRAFIETVLNSVKVQTDSFSWFNHHVNALKTTRVCLDPDITGSNDHAISRMVGNLATKYQPSKPFFEILVNSHSRASERGCAPFHISIYPNEQALKDRRAILIQQKNLPLDISQWVFYSAHLENPKTFHNKHKDKLGPNSTRIISSLNYLQTVKVNDQVVGNCWFKQPMRCLLGAIYIHLIDAKPTIGFEEAWKQALLLYGAIQKKVAIPLIESLLQQEATSAKMAACAKAALERRKHLTQNHSFSIAFVR